MSSSLRTIVRRIIWLLIILGLLVDGPLLEDLLAPPQDVWEDFPARPEHLFQDWILFLGFVVLQGLLVLAALRLRPTDPIQTCLPSHLDG
jgi:hypothetical protein